MASVRKAGCPLGGRFGNSGLSAMIPSLLHAAPDDPEEAGADDDRGTGQQPDRVFQAAEVD